MVTARPAATPAACPSAIAVTVTRVELAASRVAEWQRPTTALEVARSAEARGPFAAMRLRASLALLLTSSMALAQEDGGGRSGLTHRQRQLIITHVGQDFRARPSPADLAALLRLSPDYFTRAFWATFGIPPRAWLVRERMNAAAQRLAELLRVSDVAQELGDDDLFLFSRQFKQVFGVSPRSYRRPR